MQLPQLYLLNELQFYQRTDDYEIYRRNRRKLDGGINAADSNRFSCCTCSSLEQVDEIFDTEKLVKVFLLLVLL